MKKKVVKKVYKTLDKKVSKKHIEEEITIHFDVTKVSIKYFFIPFALVVLYHFLFSNFILLDLFLTSILVYFISSFVPDVAYLISKALLKDKRHIPSHKRKYSHTFFGLVLYSISILFFTGMLFSPNKAVVIAFFAFFGYWTHLTIDRVEMFIEKSVKFFKWLTEE